MMSGSDDGSSSNRSDGSVDGRFYGASDSQPLFGPHDNLYVSDDSMDMPGYWGSDGRRGRRRNHRREESEDEEDTEDEEEDEEDSEDEESDEEDSEDEESDEEEEDEANEDSVEVLEDSKGQVVEHSAETSEPAEPHFTVEVKKRNIGTNNGVRVLAAFAREYIPRVTSTFQTMTLRTLRPRGPLEYTVGFKFEENKKGRVELLTGWHIFQDENDLEVGTRLTFILKDQQRQRYDVEIARPGCVP